MTFYPQLSSSTLSAFPCHRCHHCRCCGWNGRHTIICALTAHALASDEAKCRQCGMDGYLTKPINIRLLVETIHKLTRKKSILARPPSSGGGGGGAQ
ncbi:unnamed protein product [Closterium sp. Yama58-4]|nr:unnamed protein product [Closterium sp. Yama58-4]